MIVCVVVGLGQNIINGFIVLRTAIRGFLSLGHGTGIE